jgi:hypothetical protein
MQAHFRALPLERRQIISIPGRLNFGSTNETISHTTSARSGISTTKIGMDRKLQEVSSTPFTTNRTPRFCFEYKKHDSLTTSEETSGHPSIYQTNARPSQSPIPQDNPQFDHANPGSNLCNIPSVVKVVDRDYIER